MPPSTAGGTPAATFSAGRPYFVMELVRGIRITDYCDKNNLSTRDRIDLFIKFCQAIRHGYQKGIIEDGKGTAECRPFSYWCHDRRT